MSLKARRVPEDNDAEPGYELRVVAYLDVLGTKAAIESSASSKRSFFRAAGPFATIHGFLNEVRLREDSGDDALRATGFSDHVLLSAAASGNGLRHVLQSAHDLFGRLIYLNRRLLRGGVVVGQLFHEAGIVFGPALIDAYDLEESTEYPRVMVSAAAVSLAGGPDFLRKGSTSTRSPHLVRDGGAYYVHPLRTRCASVLPDDLRSAIRAQSSRLRRHKCPRIRSKGAWLADLLSD